MNKRKRTRETNAQTPPEATWKNPEMDSVIQAEGVAAEVSSPCDLSSETEIELELKMSDSAEVDAQAEIEALKQQVETAQDQFLRTAAEFDNFRKRTIREKGALSAEAFADVISRWLPLIDNLDRGVQAAEARVEDAGREIFEGLQLIQRQAYEILNALAVEEIPALGESFDPNLHHAVLSISDETRGEQEIVEVFEKGYRRGERILRHAVVKVAN